ncbi:MAG: alpha/beta hydrolase [Actinomycetota bacterium]
MTDTVTSSEPGPAPAPAPARSVARRVLGPKPIRRLLVGLALLLAVAGWIGLELFQLQAGLGAPTPDAISAAATQSQTLDPPPPIETNDSFNVAVDDGVTVSVHVRETDGATANVLLVHGAGGGAWVWEEFFEQLPQHLNVYALSWRGHFTSSPVADADTADYVADQRAVIAAIGDRNELPVHVVGHSYGGATSVLATAQAPDEVGSLLLLAPVVPLDYSFVQATVAPVVVPFFLDSSAQTEEEAIRSGSGPVGAYVDMFLDEAQMERYWELYAGKPYSIEKPSLIGVDGISPDWQDLLDESYHSVADAGVPVRIAVSPYDNVVSIDDQRETAAAIGAEVIELESGHYLPLDVAAEEAVQLVIDGLE